MICIIESFDEPVTVNLGDSLPVVNQKLRKARAGRVTTEIIINDQHFTGTEYVDAWRAVGALELIALEALEIPGGSWR